MYKLLTIITCAVLTASQVSATPACGDYQLVKQRLGDQYSEKSKMMGLGANNMVFEVYASDKTGSWTIIAVRPDGFTCLMAAGQAFEMTFEVSDDT